MTRKQIIKQRDTDFPIWKFIKKKTTELTGIKKYPYRAIIAGYWMLLDKDKNEKITEHKYNFIRCYKQIPKSWQVIHHIDGNKLNNFISNLKLMTIKEHKELHYKIKNQVAKLRRKRIITHRKRELF